MYLRLFFIILNLCILNINPLAAGNLCGGGASGATEPSKRGRAKTTSTEDPVARSERLFSPIRTDAAARSRPAWEETGAGAPAESAKDVATSAPEATTSRGAQRSIKKPAPLRLPSSHCSFQTTRDAVKLAAITQCSPGGTLTTFSPFFVDATRLALRHMERRAGTESPKVAPAESPLVFETTHEQKWLATLEVARAWFGRKAKSVDDTPETDADLAEVTIDLKKSEFKAAWRTIRNHVEEIQRQLLEFREFINQSMYTKYDLMRCMPEGCPGKVNWVEKIQGTFNPLDEAFRQQNEYFKQLVRQATSLGMGAQWTRDFAISSPHPKLTKLFNIYKTVTGLDRVRCLTCHTIYQSARIPESCCNHSLMLPHKDLYEMSCITLHEMADVAAFLLEIIPELQQKAKDYVAELR